jgi:polyisoprenoid-binding protein YceI
MHLKSTRMTHIHRFVTGLVLGWLGCGAAGAQDNPTPVPAYRLDPGHTSVYWSVRHMQTSTSRGRFERIEGQVLFDPQAQRLEVGLIVDMDSVSTGMPSFDKVLRGTSLLSTAEFPQAFFTSRQARWEGDVPREVLGEVTLRGVSRPLTLTAAHWHCGFNVVLRTRVCGGDFEATLRRTDFDLHFGTPWVDNEVRLQIQVEATPVRPGSPSKTPETLP